MNKKKGKTAKKTMSQTILDRDPYASREQDKYDQPIASREYILQYIGDCKRPPTFRQLLEFLKIADRDQKRALDRRLTAMIRDGQINLVNNRYQLVDESDLITGEVIGHPDGFGFVSYAKNKPDLYLPNYEMRKVLSGDIVKVLPVEGGRHSKKTEAKIVEIVSRKIKQLVGKVIATGEEFILQPEDSSITNKVVLNTSSLQDNNLVLRHNQLVLAEITKYQESGGDLEARVIEIIGDYFAPGIEIEAALRRFEIPHEWPHEVLVEVESFTAEPSGQDKQSRLDLTNLPLVTIDGEDAKDFDDAVYCERLENGGFRLIVAIADVSSYVRPNSNLDKEAYLRGTSVYFPGKVIPMLPEVLSNGLCSLKPNVDRLCFACEAQLDSTGKLIRYRFLPAVMNSKARLTYNIVANILLNDDRALAAQYKELLPNLYNLYELFKQLNNGRKARGAIDFDSTETMIEFDENRKIADIHPVVRNDAHRLIEECMLIANVAAAHFCLKNEIPILFRNHDVPPEDKLEKLQEFLKPLGLALKRVPPTPKDISRLLELAHDRPDNHVLQIVVLRSLSQAMYEPHNKGHFGLAFEQYAHFTSPIRRYPDLILHRQLHYHLASSKKWQKFAADHYKELSKQELAYFNGFRSNLGACGEHCSSTERRADEATRDVTAWLKCEYMQDKIGQEFTGVISGVTNFGIFVELNEVYVEGMVHVSNLQDDYYIFDNRTHSLYGETTNRKFCIGEELTVIVAKVDLDNRRIDFVLPESMGLGVSNKAGRVGKNSKSSKSKKAKGFDLTNGSKPKSKNKSKKEKSKNKKRRRR